MTAPVSSLPDDQPIESPDELTPPKSPMMPDRADAPVTEVAERFLRAVIAQIPLERVEELHLFSPLRQGTVETGIAVLAARVLVPVVEASEEQREAGDPPELFDDSIVADEMIEVVADAGDDDEDVAVLDVAVVDLAADESAALDIVLDDSALEQSPYLDDDVIVAVAPDGEPDVSDDELHEAEAVHISELAPVPARILRHTVYTARYRYVIKGPERGKWESSIKAEADAPLITVETVVRGVQRRAGEDSEIVRYTAAQIARALRVPLPE